MPSQSFVAVGVNNNINQSHLSIPSYIFVSPLMLLQEKLVLGDRILV